MARGPLPNPEKRRRNAPTIPSTDLPASGRKGRPPALPKEYSLRKAGRAWWRWAWSTPQATAWDRGALYIIARRAALEDDLQVLEASEDLITQAIDKSPEVEEQLRELEALLGRIKGMASARNAALREMRELDDRLGLSPKGLAAMRWKIVADVDEPKRPVSRAGGRRRAHLTAVK